MKNGKRLDLRRGAKLRFEISRRAGDAFLLSVIAVVKRDDRTIEIERSKKVCGTEEDVWATLLETAQDRLIGLADTK